MSVNMRPPKKFTLGRIVATPGALEALHECRADSPMSSSPGT